MELSMNVVVLLYLVASVCFIQALKGCRIRPPRAAATPSAWSAWPSRSSPRSALIYKLAPQAATARHGWILGGLLIGGTAGTIMAKKVEMTKMPELVAFMHSMIGLAAVFIAIAAVAEPWAFGIVAAAADPGGNRSSCSSAPSSARSPSPAR
jgi:H+-translocating NAD(P) transhydrogenase subunit beta